MIRETIKKHLEARGESVCWLGRQIEEMGVCSRQTVNNWLNLDMNTNSGVLAAAMQILELEIVPRFTVKDGPISLKAPSKLNKRTGKKAYPHEQ